METHEAAPMTRLVAVLGYSDRSTHELHPVCAARLARARDEVGPEDVVLFSGWARGTSAATEADLMATSWARPARMRLVDRGARTTLGNALGVARASRRVGADEVLLVTSRWHARRASLLVRAALAGSGTGVRVAAAPDALPPRAGAREVGAWLLVPLLALVAARSR
jgi:uncharacterized SAM-binding protein YcdF (DUF218 family)